DYDRRAAGVREDEQPKKALATRAPRDNTSQPFAALSGTNGELSTIEKLYRNSFGNEGVTTLVSTAATRDMLMREAPNHRYLHLATHGYFAAPRFQSVMNRTLA